MKHTALHLAALTLASPALAHGGAHLHPHGGDLWMAVILAAVLAAGLYLIWGRK